MHEMFVALLLSVLLIKWRWKKIQNTGQ